MSLTIETSTWQEFKDLVVTPGLPFNYQEVTDHYYIYSADGPVVFYYKLEKDAGAEQTDFDANHKSNASVVMPRNAGNQQIVQSLVVDSGGHALDVQSDGTLSARVTDGTDSLAIGSDGSLSFVQVAGISAPVGAITFTYAVKSEVPGSAFTDDFLSIGDGVTIALTRVVVGADAASSNAGSVIDLYNDVNGDLSSLTLLVSVFSNGVTVHFPSFITVLGTATNRIVVRRQRLGSGTRYIAAYLEGYRV